jgi:tRNA threonylcarbamoyladenosine biosynthesis protein TsaE
MAKLFPVELVTPTAESTRAVAERLAPLLRAGDLVILNGDLGAGKTTFVQGLGAGLGVRGPVTSPTFVISRVHPSLVGGPPLVHVDAYRLGGIDELDDLDLDTSLEDAVTVVEWGEDLAEELTDIRLEVRLTRSRAGEPAPAAAESTGEEDADPRTLRVTPVGARWRGTDLRTALGAAVASSA